MDRKIIFVDVDKWQTTIYVTAVVISASEHWNLGEAEGHEDTSKIMCWVSKYCQLSLLWCIGRNLLAWFNSQPKTKQFGVKPGVGCLLLTRKFHSEWKKTPNLRENLRVSAEFKRFFMLSDFFNTIHSHSCGGEPNIVMLKYSLVKSLLIQDKKKICEKEWQWYVSGK